MVSTIALLKKVSRLTAAALVLGLGACAGGADLPPVGVTEAAPAPVYKVGPGDTLRIFVWGNPGLSDTVPVRPDGRVPKDEVISRGFTGLASWLH